MATFDVKKLAKRFAGRPAVPEVTVVAGANASTNIAVTGINVDDMLLSVLLVRDPGATTTASVVDETANCSITSAGNIQCTAATNTNAGDRLIVFWYKVRV